MRAYEAGVDLSPADESIRQLEAKARSLVYLAVNGKLAALFGVSDPLRKDAAAVKRLQDDGLTVVMLTGDNEHTAAAVAREVGISEFKAGMTPDDKHAEIERQAAGEVVGMVGDGINDALALARANVGFAIGQGIDIAMESAVLLMRDSLHGVVVGD